MPDLLAEYKIKFYAIVDVALLFLSLTSGSGSLLLSGVFAAVLILFLWMERSSFRPNKIDVVILLMFVYELILGNSNPGRNNSLVPILTQFIFTTYYFIIRLSMRDRAVTRLFFRLSSVLFIITTLFCMVSFYIFQKYVSEAGFDNLYDFKFLYWPFGIRNNVWATILLSFLLLYLLNALFYGARKKFTVWLIFGIPLLYCLVISFSRGIYICVGIVLAVSVIFLLVSKRFRTVYRLSIVAGMVLVFGLIYVLHKNEIERTVRLTETASQQRSLNSRISSLSYLWPVMRENPFLGVGTGNYSLAMDKYIYQDDDNTFTGFAPNIISQLSIEKGVIGLSLWVVLAIFLIVSLSMSDKDHRSEQLFIFFALSIIFLRELSFPSLLTTPGLQLLFATLIGTYTNNLPPNKFSMFDRRQKAIITIAVSLVFTYCLLLDITYTAHDKNIDSFNTALKLGLYEDAENHLKKCRNIPSTHIYHSALYRMKYTATGDAEDIHLSLSCLSKAIEANPRDIRLRYDHAMTLYLLGDKQSAKTMLEDLCENFPNNSLTHVGLGNILYRENSRDSAVPHFARAIALTPSILETEAWEQFERKDSLSSKMIYDLLTAEMQNIGNDPIKIAKHGKILYIYGDSEKASALLTRALSALPNLQAPWVYLWKIGSGNDEKAEEYLKKAKLLGFDEDEPAASEHTTTVLGDGLFLFNPEIGNEYDRKFQIWYSTTSYPDIISY